ncbi:MAG: MarR family transcriptional regulator [Deltaproteobacteria bacterium]|nr:MarR family transcriptional regulator [Deltaproteobacteria bacterium]
MSFGLEFNEAISGRSRRLTDVEFDIIVLAMNYQALHQNERLPDAQIDQFQHLIFKLYQCCQTRMQRQSEQFDLPDAELRCLRLFGRERYLTPKGLARQMGVVKSRITKIIDGLVTKQLIQRLKDPEDSRITLLSLTPQGKAKLDQINTTIASANKAVLARMTPEQRETLLIHLEILRLSMEAPQSG